MKIYMNRHNMLIFKRRNTPRHVFFYEGERIQTFGWIYNPHMMMGMH